MARCYYMASPHPVMPRLSRHYARTSHVALLGGLDFCFRFETIDRVMRLYTRVGSIPFIGAGPECADALAVPGPSSSECSPSADSSWAPYPLSNAQAGRFSWTALSACPFTPQPILCSWASSQTVKQLPDSIAAPPPHRPAPAAASYAMPVCPNVPLSRFHHPLLAP